MGPNDSKWLPPPPYSPFDPAEILPAAGYTHSRVGGRLRAWSTQKRSTTAGSRRRLHSKWRASCDWCGRPPPMQCSASIRSRCHNIYAIIRSHKTSVGGSVDCCLCRFRHHEKLAHPHPGSGSGISSETIGLRGLCAIICYWHHLEEGDLQLTVMPPQRMLKSCNSRLSALSCKFVWQTMCLLHVGILSV